MDEDEPIIPAPIPVPPVNVLDQPPKTANEKQTAKLAIKILSELNVGFYVPTREQRDALLVGFAMSRKVLYGAAFDVVRLTTQINLVDPAEIAANISSITAYEIKSTNKSTIKTDFRGYFFDLTTAELLVAQSLGERYRFAFVNTLTREWIELTLNDIFARARKVYPKWAISF